MEISAKLMLKKQIECRNDLSRVVRVNCSLLNGSNMTQACADARNFELQFVKLL